MVLKELLNIYHKELDNLFGKEEVDSFFNLLIEHYLDLKRIHMVMHPEYAITKEEEQPLFEALADLKLQKPLQYIIGETEFYGLPFKVNNHTLIPRPETEELVDWIISRYSNCNLEYHTERTRSASEDSLKILDIGTGTGCIAISLAKNLKNAKVYALDVSEDALKIATQNAELNAVDVNFIHNDILSPDCHAEHVLVSPSYDVIVSNPPYVRNLEKKEIKPNVLDNEPHLALFVEDDNPLQFYKAICEFAKHNLKDNGTLYFEINEYLGEEMIELLELFGFKDIELKKDIFGKHRMIKGVK